jgi:hypothetical protein
MPPTEPSAAAFSVLDWIGAIVSGLATLALFVFPVAAGSFRAMYADFGGGGLPALTDLVTQPWAGPVMALLPLGLLAVGVLPTIAVGRRRLAVVAAFVLSLLLLALCAWGVYMPLFEVSGAVSAQ